MELPDIEDLIEGIKSCCDVAVCRLTPDFPVEHITIDTTKANELLHPLYAEIEFQKGVNENHQMSLDDAQLRIESLITSHDEQVESLAASIKHLRGKLNDKMPVCPQCNAEMEKCWAGKCDDGSSYPCWVCNCVD